MESAVYVGRVHHRRSEPMEHRFSYRMYQLWLDLDELPAVFDGHLLWSARRMAPAWFRRSDFLGDPERPLKEAVLDRVEQETGRRPEGPVRMLAHLRYFGHAFNPVVFYYCYDRSALRVDAIVAEITNTPWKERHSYVLSREGERPACGIPHRFAKQFHVSPFFDMDLEYEWNLTQPGDLLLVKMRNLRDGKPVFHADLEMERRPLNSRVLTLALLRHPFMSLKIILAIYWQALRLKWKGIPFHVHPDKRSAAMETTS